MSTKRQVFRWIPMAVWIGAGASLAVPVHVHASESVEKPISQDARKRFLYAVKMITN